MKITVKRGLKYRIYPNKEQKILINKTLGCGRFVYNHFLRIRIDEWKFNHKSINYNDTASMLKDLKTQNSKNLEISVNVSQKYIKNSRLCLSYTAIYIRFYISM